jgi:Flp pilus assembly pilin Flp
MRPAARLRHGSFTIEYAVLLAIVAAALVGAALYTKRALCGKWRDVADGFGHGRQYEEGVTVVTRSSALPP